MRRYYIASGILLILPIIGFAVAAPVLVQQKPQAGVYVVHTTEDAKTKLGKRARGDELDEMLLKLLSDLESPFPESPEIPPAARPSSSSELSGSTDMSTNVEQPVSIPKKPSQVASSSHAPPSPGDDEANKLWLDLDGHHFSDESLAAPPSLGSLPPGPAHGWMDVAQPVPSIPNEPPQVASPGHAPPLPSDDALNELWFDLYGHHFFDESLAARPQWPSQPSGPAHGWMDVEQLVPSIPPSWGSPPSGPAHGWMDVEQPVPSIPNEPSQVASPGRAPPSLNGGGTGGVTSSRAIYSRNRNR